MSFVKLIIYIISILITAYILPGVIVPNLLVAVVLAIVLGLLNMFVRPLLILLTLPFNIITLGLFTFVINALIVILASKIVVGFQVENFGWALLFSLILSLVFSFLSRLS